MTGAPVSHEGLESTLLDFHRAPGRHPVALRQPALLFGSIREVVLIAGERSTEASGAARTAPVVAAARFFIRSALLRPGTDHYGMLGLADSADAGAIKDRYRSLMRLLHPDFAQGQETIWPADAATRLNQAYEVLSDPDRRKAYDEQLRGRPEAPAQASASASSSPRRPGALRTGPSVVRQEAYADPRQRLRKLAAGFGFVGAVAGIAFWLVNGQPEKETLVQRLRVEPSSPDTLRMSDGASTVIAAAPAPPEPVVSVVSVVSDAQTPAERAPDAKVEPAAAAVESMPAGPAIASQATATLAPPVSSPVTAVAAPTPATPAPVVIATAPVAAISAPAVALPSMMPAQMAPAAPLPVLARIEPRPLALPPAVTYRPVVATLTPPPPAPVVIAAQAAPLPLPPPPPPPPQLQLQPAAVPVPTMAEVQPQLMRLLQVIENGWGDNLLSGVESAGRRLPEGQALVNHFNDMVAGVKPIRISNVELRGQPRSDRLVVTGQVVLQVRDVTTPARKLGLHAEFILRNGEPVMTRLMRAPE